MVQVWSLSQSLELSGRLVKSSIVNGSAALACEVEVSQVDAA